MYLNNIRNITRHLVTELGARFELSVTLKCFPPEVVELKPEINI